MNIQNPSWYSSLKSISILYAHSHTGLLDGHFPLRSLIKICSQLTSLLRMPHSLHIFPLFSDKLVYDKQYKLWNYTLSILLLPFPLSLFQTLFWSLCSQPEPVYKRQKALHSNKTYHKPHFILHNQLHASAPRCHLHGVYYKQMIVCPTHTSGASYPHFHHEN